ncbi:MAG TPA: cation diffusion facilitator family transporter [Hyphomicrobiaceae bacterium]|nr:cation diffusion facilitator family transporter [Hyphomicrobiaceae bacterium]
MPQALRLKTLAAISIAVAIAVMAIKYVAYWRTGSVALYSDALESIVNVLTAMAALIAVRVGARPADRNHQFGHHKAEYLAAVLEGALIIVAAFLILSEASDALFRPRQLNEPLEGIVINGVATVLNGTWSWFLISRGRAWRSPALMADGRHLLSDVITSLGVLAGLLLATATGLAVLDPLLGGAVALYILWMGWRLMRGSASGLMDEAVNQEVAAEIRRVIADNAAGALQMHDLRTRIAGRATFIEFHLVVPGGMSVAESHEICDRLEAALEAAIDGAQVVIHVEPDTEAKAKGALQV